MGRYPRIGLGRRVGAADRQAARELLAQVGLEAFVDAPVQSLSGGQRQRALIARALITDPEILVLDEPTNGLDVVAERAFLGLVERFQARTSFAVVMISHELPHVASFATEVLLVDAERGAVEQGTVDDVITEARLSQLYGARIIVQDVHGHRAVFLDCEHEAPHPATTITITTTITTTTQHATITTTSARRRPRQGAADLRAGLGVRPRLDPGGAAGGRAVRAFSACTSCCAGWCSSAPPSPRRRASAWRWRFYLASFTADRPTALSPAAAGAAVAAAVLAGGGHRLRPAAGARARAQPAGLGDAGGPGLGAGGRAAAADPVVEAHRGRGPPGGRAALRLGHPGDPRRAAHHRGHRGRAAGWCTWCSSRSWSSSASTARWPQTLGYRTRLWNALLFATVGRRHLGLGPLPGRPAGVRVPGAARRRRPAAGPAGGVGVRAGGGASRMAAGLLGYYFAFSREWPAGPALVVAAALFLLPGVVLRVVRRRA